MSLLVPAVYVVTTADVLAHIGLVNRISVFFWRNHYSEISQQVKCNGLLRSIGSSSTSESTS